MEGVLLANRAEYFLGGAYASGGIEEDDGRALVLATVEEHSLAGGFGSAVLEALSEMELSQVATLAIGVPDKFVPHGSQDVLRKMLGLDAEGLYFRFRSFFAKAAGARRLHLEGEAVSGWILADYGSVVVHIFDPRLRLYYDLEGLWSQARLVVRVQ